MKFKVGDRIKYTSKKWGDDNNNPLWNGKHGKIIGTVIEIDGWIRVNWDNRYSNSYDRDDLKLVEEQRQLNLFGERYE